MAETSLTFLPYFERKFPLALDGVANPGHLTATLALKIKTESQQEVSLAQKTIILRGPGDILGLSKSMIARVEPPNGSNDFEPNYFPFVEFVDPDFPWRYSLDIDMGHEHEGKAQSGTASTIVLANEASSTDDVYNGMQIEITKETGSGQILTITDYNGTTKAATLDRNWDTVPDNTSEYRISSGRVYTWLSLIVLSLDEINRMQREDHLEVIKRVKDDRELLTVKRDLLPTLDNVWANAHVQLTGMDLSQLQDQAKLAEFIRAFVEANPSRHCSRLFCFRQLEPETSYFAFLTPNYKIAAKAFLGEAQDGVGSEWAWQEGNGEGNVQLPIYFRWSFMTSEKGDFEELARHLKPAAIDKSRVGTRAVDASLQNGAHADNLPYFLREGALAVPGFSEVRKPYSEASEPLPLTQWLLESLNESLKSSAEEQDDGADPLITFPVYGRFFRKTSRIELPRNDHWPANTPWVHEVNLDFRNRVAAAFGTTVVQKKQDEYAKACWYQVGEIRKANEKLRLTKAGFRSGKTMEKKHLLPLSDERFTLISAPFHAHFATQEVGEAVSLKQALADSGVSRGAISPAFKRIAHQRAGINRMDIFGPWKKAKENASFRNKLKCFLLHLMVVWMAVKLLNSLSAIFNRIRHPILKCILKFFFLKLILNFLIIILDRLGILLSCGRPRRPRGPQDIGKRVKKDFGIELPGLEDDILPPKAEIIPVQPIDIGKDFRPKFDLKKVLKNKLSNVIKFNDGRTIPEDFDPIMAAPKIDDPMYRSLRDLSLDYILPGAEYLQNNGVTLCQENRRFIESYMISVNHEMGRELVWREFPTDQRGTIFGYFWDPTVVEQNGGAGAENGAGSGEPEYRPPPDIKEIHKWTNNLGQNQEGRRGANLVLVIKGDLIRRYPGTIVYAQKIEPPGKYWSDFDDTPNPGTLIDPVFRAQVGPDILFVGFPFSLDNIRGDRLDGEYYFVLQENQDLPRFGLDVQSAKRRRPDESDDPETPTDDLSWDNIREQDMKARYIINFDNALFGDGVAPNSAAIAAKTYQKPVRVVIHSSELLKGKND